VSVKVRRSAVVVTGSLLLQVLVNVCRKAVVMGFTGGLLLIMLDFLFGGFDSP
jgi:hypothetical protein